MFGNTVFSIFFTFAKSELYIFFHFSKSECHLSAIAFCLRHSVKE